MAELKVGLAPNRTSYYDIVTNTYITLQNPVQKISYNELDMPETVKRLEKITHALFASIPALVLYEGNVPQECITAWEAKYLKPFKTKTTRDIVVKDVNMGSAPLTAQTLGSVPFADPLRDGMDNNGRPIDPNRAYDRPDKVNAASADVVTASVDQPTLLDEADLAAAQADSSEPVEVKIESVEEIKEEEGPKTATRKKAASTKAEK